MASLEEVQAGMRVIDASGSEVGTVEEVKMGDPEAVTAAGQTGSTQTDFVEFIRRAVSVDSLPPERLQRLLRLGYLKVDSGGLFQRDEYVAADDVERVAGGTVQLRVTLSD